MRERNSRDLEAESDAANFIDGGCSDSVAGFVGIILGLKEKSQRPLVRSADAAEHDRAVLPLWFRGQSRGVPELAPTVLRDWFIERVCRGEASSRQEVEQCLVAAELQLNRTFRRLGASLLPAAATLVDIYFLAQHHGMPTRLLGIYSASRTILCQA